MPYHEYTTGKGETRWKVELCYKGNRHKKLGFRTKKAAKDYEDNYIKAIDSNRVVKGVKMNLSISELADLWLADIENRVKPSTWDDYETSIRLRIEPAFKKFKAREVLPIHVQHFMSDLAAKCSPRTANKTLAPLRGMFDLAVTLGVVVFNPCLGIRRVKEPRKEVECFTSNEAWRLIDAATGRDRLIYLTALTTGLRQGEIFGLKWKDIDLDAGLIHVRRAYRDGVFSDPKTDYGRRSVPINDQLLHELKAHRNGQGPEDMVFAASNGSPINKSNFFRDSYKPALNAAGIRDLPFHALRHAFASMLISKGTDIFYVSRILGHARVQVTLDFYGHLLHDPRAQIERLNEIFAPPAE